MRSGEIFPSLTNCLMSWTVPSANLGLIDQVVGDGENIYARIDGGLDCLVKAVIIPNRAHLHIVGNDNPIIMNWSRKMPVMIFFESVAGYFGSNLELKMCAVMTASAMPALMILR